MPDNGDLTKWARQGVLLLNTVLTVRAHQANSHRGIGWEEFTDAAIRVLAEEDRPMVFILWGSAARRKKAYDHNPKHLVIESAHPSPLSAYNGFFGSRPVLEDATRILQRGSFSDRLADCGKAWETDACTAGAEKEREGSTIWHRKKGAVVTRQAAFLMTAQMISSVIGLLYRSPLPLIMGDVGDGYYQFAQEWYTIILLISSYSIPSAVSKVMAERLAVHQYKTGTRFKVFRAALLYVLVVGASAAAVAFFGAPFFLANQPDAVLALRVLAPTIFLSGFLGCMRGFFQAHNTMKPTAISQIAEQFLNAAVSVLAAYLLTRPYLGQENLRARYGAAGGTIGTSAGVLTGLLIMLAVFLVNRKLIGAPDPPATGTGEEEPYREVFRVIF